MGVEPTHLIVTGLAESHFQLDDAATVALDERFEVLHVRVFLGCHAPSCTPRSKALGAVCATTTCCDSNRVMTA